MSTGLRYLLIGLLMTASLAVMVARKQYTRTRGKVIMLETKPVDPRDLFRGDYVILSYAMNRLSSPLVKSGYERNQTVWVTLSRKGVFWEPTAVSPEKPGALKKEEVAIRGKVKYTGKNSDGDYLENQFGIENYFIPEGKGMDLEQKRGKGLRVEVAVDEDGDAAIRALFHENILLYRESLF